MNITEQEYWKEVENLASDLWDEAIEEHEGDFGAALDWVHDSRLHETIDGHQWVIYSGYNLDVIQYSDNDQYAVDEFGGDMLEHSLKTGGLSGLHQTIAYFALYADVSERIHREYA